MPLLRRGLGIPLSSGHRCSRPPRCDPDCEPAPCVVSSNCGVCNRFICRPHASLPLLRRGPGIIFTLLFNCLFSLGGGAAGTRLAGFGGKTGLPCWLGVCPWALGSGSGVCNRFSCKPHPCLPLLRRGPGTGRVDSECGCCPFWLCSSCKLGRLSWLDV